MERQGLMHVLDASVLLLLSLSVIYPAIKISPTKDIAFYDAFYLALAQEIKSPFITADKKLYQKTKDLEFVKLLAEFEPSPFKETGTGSEEDEV